MSKLSKTDKSALIAGTFNDAVTGGTAEALNSVAHDMAKTIYNEPGQYPTLESILQNATTGMVSGSLGGAAVGGTGRAINLKKRNMRRNKQTTTALVDQHGFAWEVLDYNPENKIAEVLSPNGKNTITLSSPIRSAKSLVSLYFPRVDIFCHTLSLVWSGIIGANGSGSFISLFILPVFLYSPTEKK